MFIGINLGLLSDISGLLVPLQESLSRVSLSLRGLYR